MKKFSLSLICFFLLVAGNAFCVELRTGHYELRGSNNTSGFTQYRGEVIITPNGTNFGLVWLIGGHQAQIGTGILVDNILSVCYEDLKSGSFGVVSFQVLGNGQLKGFWSPINGTSYGVENLTWLSY